jgi:cyclophilin family peptidyl-prolyl cis-trans isomerase
MEAIPMKFRQSKLVTFASMICLFAVLSACGNTNNSQKGAISTAPTATATATTTPTATPSASAAPTAADKVAKKWSKAPDMMIDPTKSYEAEITTSKGAFKVQLFAKEAPKTVNNFVFLAKEGFYDNIMFHRIIQSFMIQTGDPLGNGTGGPGYSFEDELKTPYKYEPGILAMANSGPNTNGSQFFICTGKDAASLNSAPNYTIFGKVIEGMDNVGKIAATPVKSNPYGGEPSLPTEKVTITSISITEK